MQHLLLIDPIRFSIKNNQKYVKGPFQFISSETLSRVLQLSTQVFLPRWIALQIPRKCILTKNTFAIHRRKFYLLSQEKLRFVIVNPGSIRWVNKSSRILVSFILLGLSWFPAFPRVYPHVPQCPDKPPAFKPQQKIIRQKV